MTSEVATLIKGLHITSAPRELVASFADGYRLVISPAHRLSGAIDYIKAIRISSPIKVAARATLTRDKSIASIHASGVDIARFDEYIEAVLAYAETLDSPKAGTVRDENFANELLRLLAELPAIANR